MAMDLGEIEVMLQTLAKHISANTGRMIVELEEAGEPESGEESLAREALIAGIGRKHRAWERVETQLLEVRRELFDTSEETFTGPWPPTDPASLSAQWVALLDDVDELPEEYLGEGHFDEGSPLREAWEELDAAVLALDPREPMRSERPSAGCRSTIGCRGCSNTRPTSRGPMARSPKRRRTGGPS